VARLKIRGRCSKKSIKPLNRVSISVSLGLGLVLGLVLGLMPSCDIVLKVPSSHLHVSPKCINSVQYSAVVIRCRGRGSPIKIRL